MRWYLQSLRFSLARLGLVWIGLVRFDWKAKRLHWNCNLSTVRSQVLFYDFIFILGFVFFSLRSALDSVRLCSPYGRCFFFGVFARWLAWYWYHTALVLIYTSFSSFSEPNPIPFELSAFHWMHKYARTTRSLSYFFLLSVLINNGH